MNLEPANSRPPRHIFRWVFLSMAILLSAGIFIIFQWGNEKESVRVWKLRGNVLLNQIRHGRDRMETQDARWALATELLAQGSYELVEDQIRAILASEERLHGAGSKESATMRILRAECLFLQGKRAEASSLMQHWLGLALSKGLSNSVTVDPNIVAIPRSLVALGRGREGMALARFTLEQGRVAFQDKASIVSLWEKEYQGQLGWSILRAVAPPWRPETRLL